MLKNKLWIVALFAAFAIAFFGCTEEGAMDDDSGPKKLVNPVVDGASFLRTTGRVNNWDTIDIKGGKAGATALANYEEDTAHTITVYGATVPGTASIRFANTDSPYGTFAPEVTAAAGTGLFTLEREFSWAEITDAAQNIRIQLPTTTTWFEVYEIVVKAGSKVIYKLSEDGEIQSAAAGSQPIYDDVIGTTWYFKAGGPEIKVVVPEGAAPTPPPEDVIFTPGTPASADKVVDTSVAGNVVKMKRETPTGSIGTTYVYTFPTKATNSANGLLALLDIEKDYDFIEIEYTVKNVVTTSGGTNLKARVLQADKATGYGNVTGGNWVDLGGAGTYGAAATADGGPLKLQTWGSGGKGCFVIGFNQGDIGASSNGADSLDFEITKVTFTKGTRYTVKFYTPQTPNLNNIADVVVLSGNTLGGAYPTLINPGWSFLGWCVQWDQATGQGIGSQVVSGTPITANTRLYARWLGTILDPVLIDDVDDLVDLITHTGNSDWAVEKEQDDDSNDIATLELLNASWGGNWQIALSDLSANWAAYTCFTLKVKVLEVAGATVQANFKTSGGDYSAGGISGAADGYQNFGNNLDKELTLNFPISRLNTFIGSQGHTNGTYKLQIISVSLHNDLF